MKAPALDSSFDAAFWFLDRALNDNEYLQPPKVQRLIYLAQAYYAVMTSGHKLMPATFVVHESGPIEPTLYRAFENERPYVSMQHVPEDAEHLMDSIWRRFGAHSADYLTKMVINHAPYAMARQKGMRVEIPLKAMMLFYGKKKEVPKSVSTETVPSVDVVIRPKMMRSQTGKPVKVQKWAPKRVSD